MDDLALRELPPELAEAAARELSSDERVVWIGQPVATRTMWMTFPIVLFGLPWTAFALFWMAAAWGFGGADQGKGIFVIFPLFGLPFVLIGVWMLTAPYWAWRKAKRTAYVITSQRALIIVAGRVGSVRSFAGADLKQLERRDRATTGDIIIEQPVPSPDGRGRTAPVGFFGITDAKRVEDLLRQVP